MLSARDIVTVPSGPARPATLSHVGPPSTHPGPPPKRVRAELRLLERTVDGIDDRAAATPLVPGGSHLHWLLAHLVVSRVGLLGRLGGQPVWDDTEAGPMTVAEWIEFLAWHETYQLGKAILYRRAAGLPTVVG